MMTGPDTRARTASAWLGFLSDEARTTLHGEAALREIHAAVVAGRPDAERLFSAANLLALLLFRQGLPDQARQLCRDGIAYALRRRGTAEWPALVPLAIQPQVNLFRLDGYGDDVEGALAGFRALAELADGRPARLPELALGADDLAAAARVRPSLSRVLRNMVVTDTCKILWRTGQLARLLDHAACLRQRWPDLRSTVAHAAEAPWLVDAMAAPSLPDSVLDGGAYERRLGYLRLLHLAGQAAAAGCTTLAHRTALRLYRRRDVLDGDFASPLTPLRCLGSLGDTLLRLGETGLARPLLQRLADDPRTPADPTLYRGVWARLGFTAPPPAAADRRLDASAPPPEELLAALRARLAA